MIDVWQDGAHFANSCTARMDKAIFVFPSDVHAVTHAPEALRYAVMSRIGMTDGYGAKTSESAFRFSVRDVWD